jgi:hypothetical protein
MRRPVRPFAQTDRWHETGFANARHCFMVACVFFNMRRLLILPILVLPLLSGCLHVTMDVNANVNVNVKLDKALTDFFGDLDKKSATMAAPSPEAE